MTVNEKTYEMLWDCKYCGSAKLLGLTHRHCPSCGAPQDATSRYFPADEERIAVEDHVFVGADLRCVACGEASGARCKHCRNCGAPLTEATSVAVRGEQVHAAGQFGGDSGATARAELLTGPTPATTPAKPRRSGLGALAGCGCVAVLVGLTAVIALFLFWRREAAFEVTGHRWERHVAVESFGKATETAWCDSAPAGGREIARTRQERSTRQVPDGQECRTRKQDLGDGTFKEIEECQPKTRSEPVLDDRCTYEVMRWAVARKVTAQGSSADNARSWPSAEISRPGQCDGCEREGARTETYTVHLKEVGGRAREHTCVLPEARWAALREGSRVRSKVNQLTGSLDCSSLTPAQ